MDPQPPQIDPGTASQLDRALRSTAGNLEVSRIGGCMDATLEAMIGSALERAGSHEGTLWAADRDRDDPVLVPIYHYRPGADTSQFLRDVVQPLGTGIISMVFAGGSSLCENGIANNPTHSKQVDRATGRRTGAMIAAPVHSSRVVVAVLTGVKIVPEGISQLQGDGFALKDLETLQSAARLAGEVIEHRLLASLCGWRDA